MWRRWTWSLDFARWQQIADFAPAETAAFAARGQAMDEKFRHLAQDRTGGAQPLLFNGQAGADGERARGLHSLVGELLSKQCGTFALMWAVARTPGPGGLRSAARLTTARRWLSAWAAAATLQACGFRLPADRLPELLGGNFKA